jgi:SAM-dependent methyltransferase
VPSHWFEPLADHLGPAYLRYAFTKGTVREVDALWKALRLAPGARLLDVGCGPGRHAAELSRRGVEVVGVDISERFLRVARDTAPDARFVRADARALPCASVFDAAISLCQGAFGLNRVGDASETSAPDPDLAVLSQIRTALKPGGRLALTAFSSYFQVRYLEDRDTFDAATGLNHERTELLDEAGAAIEADLWTTCFTPRELRLLCAEAGLAVDDIWSVTPGDYAQRPPDVEHPEFLLLARRDAAER